MLLNQFIIIVIYQLSEQGSKTMIADIELDETLFLYVGQNICMLIHISIWYIPQTHLY